MSTMRDVALRAGVSAKTVSRVMHNDRYVSDEVRRRVQEAIAELRYVPNALARSFRSGRDAAIGIAVPDISDPFFAAVTEAAVGVARARNAAVFVTSTGNDPADEQPALEALLSRQIAGLICTPVSTDQSYLQPWQERTAMVFIDRAPSGITADHVVEDDQGGTFAAISHLIGHGHRRIAFIGDEPTVFTTANRLKGYRAALAEHRMAVDPSLLALGASNPSQVDRAVRTLLDLDDPPTALFSSNARCTILLIPTLLATGRTDVALFSFGDFPLATALDPAPSVLDQDPLAVGQVAATRLFERLDDPGKRRRRRITLPVTLVPRGSCCADPPRPGSPAAVATAYPSVRAV